MNTEPVTAVDKIITAQLGNQVRYSSLPAECRARLESEYVYENPKYGMFLNLKRHNPAQVEGQTAPSEFIKLHNEQTLEYPFTSLVHLHKMGVEFKIEDRCVTPAAIIPSMHDWFVRRPNQEQFLTNVGKSRTGLIRMPTGAGKTVSMLLIAQKHQTTTLILVPTNDLVTQTIEKIEFFTGHKAQTLKEAEKKLGAIVVATYQSFLRGNRGLSEAFGLILYDEIHVACGEGFSRTLQMFSARYRFGFSATYNRNDGGERLLLLLFNKYVHVTENQEMYDEGIIIPVTVQFHNTPWRPYRTFSAYEVNILIKTLATSKKRNQFLADSIRSLCAGKSCAVITQTVEHLNNLRDLLEDLNPLVYHAQISKKKKEMEEYRKEFIRQIHAERETLSICTSSSIAVGTDIPPWECLFLVSPFNSRVKCEQTAGRIMRAYNGKDKCYLHDYNDPHCPLLCAKTDERRAIYQQLKFELP